MPQCRHKTSGRENVLKRELSHRNDLILIIDSLFARTTLVAKGKATKRLLFNRAGLFLFLLITLLMAPSSEVSAANNPPATPVLIEPSRDGQTVHPADVHMATSVFSDSDSGNTHACTDWEIWTVSPAERVWVSSCITGVGRVHVHQGDGAFENSHVNRREFMYDTDYRLRVRFKDDSGDTNTQWSAWSSRPFRTSSQPPVGGAIAWTAKPVSYTHLTLPTILRV